MSSESSLWFRVGYALEQARQLPSSGRRGLAGLKDRVAARGGGGGADSPDRQGGRRREASEDGDDQTPLHLDGFLASGAVALGARLLDRWRPGGSSGVGALVRAGAAGAVAALLVELVRPLLRSDTSAPELDGEAAEHLLAGAGQGLVYGGVLEPWIPGPPILKGTVFGSAEYLLNPSGGVTHLLGSRSPLGRVPVVLKILEGIEGRDRSFLEHLTFGVAMAVLYGSPSSNGILDEEE